MSAWFIAWCGVMDGLVDSVVHHGEPLWGTISEAEGLVLPSADIARLREEGLL